MGRPPLPRPPVEVLADGVRVPLTQGASTLIDERDWPRVAPLRWCLFRAGAHWPYAATGRRGGGLVLLHRFLLDAPPHLHVDHKNGDTLDNRRPNLRLVSPAENHANQRHFGTSSRYRGVIWHRGKWRAVVVARGVRHYLGRFADEEAAARAVDASLRVAWGDHARLNFPPNLVHDQLG